MAKPDLKNGWFQLAHELDAALSLADFGKLERLVIREMFAAIFGKAKLRTVKLNAPDIAARAGVGEKNLFRAIRSLIGSGVIAEEGEAFRFIKDYEVWTRNGEPRLTPAQVEYCKAAAAHSCSLAPKNPTPKVKPHKQPSGVSQDTNSVSRDTDELRYGVLQDTKQCLTRHQMVSYETPSVPAPYRNARGIQNIQDRQEGDVVVLRTHETDPPTETRTEASDGHGLRSDAGISDPPSDRPQDASIAGQVFAMIVEASRDEHTPRGNTILADDLAGTASRWVSAGLSTSAILEAFRLAIAAVDNPFRIGAYAGKIVKSLDNGIRVTPAEPSARPSPFASRPVGLSPANQRRREFSEKVKLMPIEKWSAAARKGKA